MEIRATLSQFWYKLRLLRRDLLLFFESPKAYLYTFLSPSNKKIFISPYNPKVTDTGKFLESKIHAAFSNLTIHFIGASNLGLSQGEGDIDLLIECPKEDFHTYVPGLISLFGKPDKKRHKFIEWRFEKNGYKVELVLADPSSYIIREPLKAHEELKRNKKLLQEYEKFKSTLNGLSVREYKKRKLEFFNKVRRELKSYS